MAVVDCTIDDLLKKLDTWIPLWFGDVASNTGDTVLIPVEYGSIFALCRYISTGGVYYSGPFPITNSTINLSEQRLDYVKTEYGCRIYKLVGVSDYTDNFLMLYGKLAINLYYKFIDFLSLLSQMEVMRIG